MGPRRWSRGRGSFERSGRRRVAMLQWGHGDGAVEELCRVIASRPTVESFNGATAMEPWKSAGRCRIRQRLERASMGPRRWSRGRARSRSMAAAGDYSFNGATAMEPWKSTRHDRVRSTPSSLQWGHGDGAVEEPLPTDRGTPVRSFNGATAMEPWKSDQIALTQSELATASMGPRRWSRGRASASRESRIALLLQWGHGDGAVEEVRPLRTVASTRHSFNGATAMEPWKSSSRRLVAGRWASMGPRRWSRGRAASVRIRIASDAVLQWGHGDGAVEERRRSGDPDSAHRRFNGATAMEPWKSQTRSPVTHRGELASMGPRRWSRGRARAIAASAPADQSFNGATAMEPWKRWLHRASIVARPEASMGPRRWSRGRGHAIAAVRPSPRWLQWGHGDGAVEERRLVAHLASRRNTLQWGHGDGAVEERWPHRCAAGQSGFNGATAMEPWKSHGSLASVAVTVRLQWGHGDGAVEELRSRPSERPRTGASMGPRRWSRGRAQATDHPSRRASMGPRRWSRGRGRTCN